MASTSRNYQAVIDRLRSTGSRERRMRKVVDALWAAFENLGYGIRRTDQGLIVYTDRPEKTLQEAGTLIQHYGDTLLDIRLLRPGIEQFIQALAYHE